MTQHGKKTILGARLARCARTLSTFLGDKAGTTILITALTFPVLLGMAGLGFDATVWYMEKRETQTIADNAAMAAVIEYTRSGYDFNAAKTAAIKDAERHKFVDGSDGQVLVSAMNNCGVGGATINCIEVIVNQQRGLYLTSFLLDAPVTIQNRAVGGIVLFGEHCVIAFNESADDAIRIDGNANANVACGVASNSSSDTAIGIYGTADMTASPVQAYGDVYDPNDGLTSDTPPQPLSERVDDPYEGVYMPQDLIDPSCSSTAGPPDNKINETITPGYYCHGLKITGNVDMLPGVYVMDAGDFDFSTGGVLTGTDVTIVLTASDPAKIGTVKLAGGGNITLDAPNLGGHSAHPVEDPTGEFVDKYGGLLFIQDPAAPCCLGGSEPIQNMITGGGAMDLEGALYFPSQQVVYSGGTGDPDGCTLIYADTVDFQGTSFIKNDIQACIDAGIEVATQSRVRLTE